MVPPGSVSSPMTRWRSMEPGSCLLYGFVGKSTGIQGNQKEVGVLGFNFPIKLWDLVNLYQPAPSINKSSRIWGDIPSPSIKHTPEWFSQGGLHIWDHRMGYLLWGGWAYKHLCHSLPSFFNTKLRWRWLNRSTRRYQHQTNTRSR